MSQERRYFFLCVEIKMDLLYLKTDGISEVTNERFDKVLCPDSLSIRLSLTNNG